MEDKTLNITRLFDISTAKSTGFDNYTKGTVPFVSNGFYNNGIVGFVEPFDDDRVFNRISICVSAFCEATVHMPPFLPRGNGGSGLIVLTPKTDLSYDQLLLYAAIINKCLKWKYSYGRMVTKGRFESESIPNVSFTSSGYENKIVDLIPKDSNIKRYELNLNLERILITKLFTLEHGDFHSLDDLDEGKVPTVSRSSENNGVVGFYDVPEGAEVYDPLTITVSTVSGDSFVQLEKYIATDNVVICKPKVKLKIETLFFITMMLNREKWRWMYGRQCYKTKFAKTKIYLPYKDGNIDEDTIGKIVKSAWGWNYIKSHLIS